MTTTDANGIAFLETTDAISPFHTLINGLQSATSTAIGSARTRLDTLDGAWVAYTPVLTAATTNPVLGTGAIVQGSYKMIGTKTCVWRVAIQSGSAGFSGGSGQYGIAMPKAATGMFPIIGSGWLYGGAGFVPFIVDGGTSSVLRMIKTATGGGSIDNTSGFNAGGSVLTMSGTYQTV